MARHKRCKGNGSETQRGASLVEFSIIAPIIMLMGAGTLQAGLLYHNKTILNYATFEAARVGATRHAQHKPMRQELGIRLAPLYGGDGTLEMAALAMGRSAIEVESPLELTGAISPPTKLEILSPSLEMFEPDAWGEDSLEYENQRVIPNSHLKHQGGEVRGGLTLADANLLKIEVTHGVELKVPVVGPLLLNAMAALTDPGDERQIYYLSGRFPLKSSATVRMQSEAWQGAIVEAEAEQFGSVVASLEEIGEQLVAPGEEEGEVVECGEDGLGPSTAELVASGQMCLVGALTPEDYQGQPC